MHVLFHKHLHIEDKATHYTLQFPVIILAQALSNIKTIVVFF